MEEKHYCSYCKAELNPLFYFCTVCAQPYKKISTVTPEGIKRKLSFHEKITLRAPKVGTIFWSYFTLLVTTAIVLNFIPDGSGSILKEVIPTIGIVGITLFFAIKYFPSLKIQLNPEGLFHPWFLVGLLGTGIFLGINWGYHSFINYLSGGNLDFSGTALTEDFSKFWLIVFFCLIPAITEELAFRGLIQRWLIAALDKKDGLLLTAALFSLLHFSIISLPYLFTLGLFLGWIKEKTGSLYPVMILHFIHNIIALLYLQF